MTNKAADDFENIARRMEEIRQERMNHIMGVPLEEAKPVEAPKDIDWSTVYGVPSGSWSYDPA